jgi:membrane-associated protease RseP (regulator of RpoE activity)
MSIEDLRDRLGWLAMVALVLGSGAVARAQDPASKDRLAQQEDLVYFLQDDAPEGGERLNLRLSDYWLGVSGDTAEPALRAQLKLGEGQGFLVTGVQEDSPAAKADVEKFDVLLLVDGKNVGELKDLVTVVDENKDKEVELTLLRAGEKRSVKLTPVKRPNAKPAAPDGPNPGELDRWINRMPGHRGRVQLFNVGPGRMADHFAVFTQKAEFPADLGVTIDKQGNTPAKIVVKRGDHEWTTTDDKLESLPEDVRGHVAGLLGHPSGGPNISWQMAAPQPAVPGPRMRIQTLPRMERLQMRGPGENDRLEELTKQLDELRKSVDELREAAKRDKLLDK